MKLRSFYLISLLLLIFTFSTISVEATHHKNPTRKEISTKGEKTRKTPKTFFKKIFSGKQNPQKNKKISRNAVLALVIGGVAFFCLLAPILFGVGSAIWILAGILAIIGDILAISVLWNIRNSEDPSEYSLEIVTAIIGLVLSLLTGLIPLAFLIIVLLAL